MRARLLEYLECLVKRFVAPAGEFKRVSGALIETPDTCPGTFSVSRTRVRETRFGAGHACPGRFSTPVFRFKRRHFAGEPALNTALPRFRFEIWPVDHTGLLKN